MASSDGATTMGGSAAIDRVAGPGVFALGLLVARREGQKSSAVHIAAAAARTHTISTEPLPAVAR